MVEKEGISANVKKEMNEVQIKDVRALIYCKSLVFGK